MGGEVGGWLLSADTESHKAYLIARLLCIPKCSYLRPREVSRRARQESYVAVLGGVWG